MPTHKKGHDKDKYYHLAKDQGYRSRAAFKLIQINRRFDILTKARVCVDLCAAPGGWCQVAEKCMPPGSIILGVDLLPIRAIRNVKTIVSDITTAECRRIVSQELTGWKADVVLCDGAPNIGSEYGKDAYVQNELVLAALKTATDHLIEGGSFCTKVYRSQDYNALVWVLQQLFEDVQAMKPNSSRSQSAEIFLVCMKYTSPKFIDPKLLDPNHVFKAVRDPGLAKIDVMHKKYEQHNKKNRAGYDENLGILLSSSKPVSEFIKGKDPVRMLTDCNNFVFTDECQAFLNHKSTTEEIKICLQDLRVLGKIDYKKLLKWRSGLRKEYVESKQAAPADTEEPGKEDRRSKNALPATEEEIQEEIWEMRSKMAKEAKKEKKSNREKMAKERKRQALGITSNSFAVDDDPDLFRVPGEMRESHLKSITEVNLEDADAGNFVASDSDDDDDSEGSGGDHLKKIVTKRSRDASIFIENDDIENELEEDYIRYLRRADNSNSKLGYDSSLPETASQKRRRMSNTADAILKRQGAEDEDISRELASAEGVSGSVSQYADMLSGKKGDSDSSDSSSDDDNSVDDALENEQGLGGVTMKALDALVQRNKKHVKSKDCDKFIALKDDKPESAKAAQWFSHPLFRETMSAGNVSDEVTKDQLMREQEIEKSVMDSMPKSDKQVRKEKRKREEEKRMRKEARKQARLDIEGDNNGSGSSNILGFEIDRPRSDVKYDDHDVVIDEKTYQKRELIKKGMGKQLNLHDSKKLDAHHIEVVSAEKSAGTSTGADSFFERMDTRTYDSDSEDYDNKDRAMTLALGTMMLRKSKQKAMVDASYNRFAWNDPGDLPAWFMDDELKHNKPQLPIPQALMDQVCISTLFSSDTLKYCMVVVR